MWKIANVLTAKKVFRTKYFSILSFLCRAKSLEDGNQMENQENVAQELAWNILLVEKLLKYISYKLDWQSNRSNFPQLYGTKK